MARWVRTHSVGDGAGILIQIPDPLFRQWAKNTGVPLPPPGDYAVGMCFLPREAKAREIVVKQFEHFVRVEGQKLLGWRDVPPILRAWARLSWTRCR